MPYRVGVRPGKPVSALGLAAGLLFVVLGLTVIIPLFGAFGVVWTALAAVIAAYHGYNLVSTRGLPTYQAEVRAPGPAADFDDRLRRLAKLREDGLLSEEEYQRKRGEILREQW
jgi:hypothetical protein